MIKSIRRHLAQERDSYKLPRRVRDLIPIHRIWKDGIFLSEKKYSKTYCFSDINYQVVSLADKKQMFFGYERIRVPTGHVRLDPFPESTAGAGRYTDAVDELILMLQTKSRRVRR